MGEKIIQLHVHSVFIQHIINDVSRCEDRTLAEFLLVGDLGWVDLGRCLLKNQQIGAGGLFLSV